jgi:hypothetical protein
MSGDWKIGQSNASRSSAAIVTLTPRPVNKKFSPEKIGTHERHTGNSAMLCWLFWIAARLT